MLLCTQSLYGKVQQHNNSTTKYNIYTQSAYRTSNTTCINNSFEPKIKSTIIEIIYINFDLLNICSCIQTWVTTFKNSFDSNWVQNPNRTWSKSWLFYPIVRLSWILDHLVGYIFLVETIVCRSKLELK